jgi:23S rRNA (uridine2552-2'-O)-methyltransferase
MTKPRSQSSSRWLQEHESDPFVKEARKLGYRSRAVFKLLEIQQKDRLIKPGQRVVDLGAAPGGWSQIARPWLGEKGTLIALDILPMEELPNVEFILGDFKDEIVLKALQAALLGEKLDLVMSDIAPNMSGVDSADQMASLYMCELAQDFAVNQLKQGGSFLVKIFQGEGFDQYLKQLRTQFATVQIRKPKASRQRSREVYLLARGFRGLNVA